MKVRLSASEFAAEVEGSLPFTANTGQKEAINALSRFLFDDNERSLFVLKGYAGTGKTNLVSALTRVLPRIRWRSVLLAPTGRAAKVFTRYSHRPAFTIHKKIYRQNNEDGQMYFILAENLHRNTVFIVDESSMIGARDEEPGSRNLLDDLFEYVFSGENCRLIFVGDSAQLPPVGTALSPALDEAYLKRAYHLTIRSCELKEVARQRLESGILANATAIRLAMEDERPAMPALRRSHDVTDLNGSELADVINQEIRTHGEENVIIITRSNRHAGLYNRSFRNLIRNFEEDLCTGDRLMVVKNNYFWLGNGTGEAGFVANGDMAEITAIRRREQMYNLNFADCKLRFTDHPQLPEQEIKIITDCLYMDTPALTAEQQKTLYNTILEDVADEPRSSLRKAYLRTSPYYNALQVKFSYAITCHKSQGGQWPVVFIDQGILRDDINMKEHLRWLYTAITRATERVYLLNFDQRYFTS